MCLAVRQKLRGQRLLRVLAHTDDMLSGSQSAAAAARHGAEDAWLTEEFCAVDSTVAASMTTAGNVHPYNVRASSASSAELNNTVGSFGGLNSTETDCCGGAELVSSGACSSINLGISSETQVHAVYVGNLCDDGYGGTSGSEGCNAMDTVRKRAGRVGGVGVVSYNHVMCRRK